MKKRIFSSTIAISMIASNLAFAVDSNVENITQNLETFYESQEASWWADYNANTTWWNALSVNLSDDINQHIINAFANELENNQISDYMKSAIMLGSQGYDASDFVDFDGNSYNVFELLSNVQIDEQFYYIYTAPYTLLALNSTGEVDITYNDHIDFLIEELPSVFENPWSSEDTIGSVIQGLSLVYEIREDATITIVDTLEILSNSQGENGSFGNANADAMVSLALTMLGIDSNNDSRFVKNGNGLIDGLLTYALEDNSGFGYMSNDEFNEYATKQAFVAVSSYNEFLKTNKSYNPFDFSHKELVQAIAVEIESNENSGGSNGGGTTVTPTTISTEVSIIIDDEVIKTQTISATEGSTASKVIIEMLELNEYEQVGAEAGYIKSITIDGETYGEFTHGQYSGWVYYVNGEYPGVGILDYKLSNGDKVQLTYITDYVETETGGSNSSSSSSTTGSTSSEEDDLTSDEEILTQENAEFSDVSIEDWYFEAVNYVIDNGLFTGTSNNNFAPNENMSRAMIWTVLYRNAGQTGETTGANWYEEAQKWASEQNISDGSNPNGDMTREELATMLYRSAGEPEVITTEISLYNDGSDVSLWAENAMNWAVEQGIISGKGNNNLAPTDTATRAEVATMLQRYLTK